jgi:hypothetical protein
MKLRFPTALGAVLGLAYGLFARAVFGDVLPAPFRDAFPAMSLAFLVLVPFLLGVLIVRVAEGDQRRGIAFYLLMPWIPCAALLVVFGLLAWEGLICLVIMAPAFFVAASLGGATMGLVRHFKRKPPPAGIAAMLAIPFALAPAERRIAAATSVREVHTEVRIAADAATVFRNIAEVRAIADTERSFSFFALIGIPRPSEALLSHPGIGGIRSANFVEGIRFRETITEWEPDRALGFGIAVDPESVSPAVLDEHVAVGGPYFDVVYGAFHIQPVAGGVVLHLDSRHRLTTHFNGYAGLWSDAIMADLQRGICRIIQRRSEAEAARH